MKQITIVFIGSVLLEYLSAKVIAPYLGVDPQTPLFALVVTANLLSAFLADIVYKGDFFKKFK